jgi:nitroreductase
MTTLYAGKKSDEVIEHLLKRRSVRAADLCDPAPGASQLEVILQAAARVSDHGRAVPFYFLVFEGQAREEAGNIIRTAFIKNNPEAGEEKAGEEAQRLMRAPLVIAVVYRARRGKHPLWEQMLTAGAVCQNLILAANASGFGANWLSEWFAYDGDVRAGLGLDERDVLAGFIHIGSVPKNLALEERERPDLSQIVTRWSPDAALNKGDAAYDRDKFEFPKIGFNFKI